MDLIYIAYQKKVSSINSHLRKIPGKCDTDLIHRLRLDIKRIRVIFYLLEVLSPEKFNAKSRYSHFRNLFRYAGQVREIQLEIKALDRYHSSGVMIRPFKNYLLKEEKMARKKMASAVKKMDLDKFQNIENKIRKICNKISTHKFFDKTFSYILDEAGKILTLLDSSEESEKIHKIRQHLKSMGNVITLISPVSQNKELASISRKIKVIDSLMGSYHDHFILLAALKNFIETRDAKETATSSSLKTFFLQVKKENEALLKNMNPKINSKLTILLRDLINLISLQKPGKYVQTDKRSLGSGIVRHSE